MRRRKDTATVIRYDGSRYQITYTYFQSCNIVEPFIRATDYALQRCDKSSFQDFGSCRTQDFCVPWIICNNLGGNILVYSAHTWLSCRCESCFMLGAKTELAYSVKTKWIAHNGRKKLQLRHSGVKPFQLLKPTSQSLHYPLRLHSIHGHGGIFLGQ